MCLQVETEHAILAQLATQKLSFKVPTALPAVDSGAPYVVLSSGAAACVFEIIPGKTYYSGRHRQRGWALLVGGVGIHWLWHAVRAVETAVPLVVLSSGASADMFPTLIGRLAVGCCHALALPDVLICNLETGRCHGQAAGRCACSGDLKLRAGASMWTAASGSAHASAYGLQEVGRATGASWAKKL